MFIRNSKEACPSCELLPAVYLLIIDGDAFRCDPALAQHDRVPIATVGRYSTLRVVGLTGSDRCF